MFSSISKAIPQTQVSTSFTATRPLTIVPVTPFAITVNGQVPSDPNLVTCAAGDLITAVITTPDDWLWYEFYYYQIDGVPQTFAVINKSSYVIRVKPDDVIKRWYIYDPADLTLTYKSIAGVDSDLSLSNNYERLTETYHVVLNPLDNSVYFYGSNGIQLSKVVLPAAPLDYVKVPEKQSVVVLVFGGESYEIFLNNTVAGIAPFYARRNYSEFTDLGYVKQLPGEDLISYLRRARVKKAIPPATCLTYNGLFVIAGGNGSVWVVDPMANFTMISNFSIDEFVLNITPLPDNAGALLVTQSQKIYVMDMDGNFEQIYQGTALWQPALFNGKIYIPEGNVGLLKVYNPVTALFEADIALPEFSPSYTTVVDNKMYVCGHDSERVLVFDSTMNYTELYFEEKVTLVSVADGTVVASHWLKDFKILDLPDLQRIVKVEFINRTGPVSHVGTTVVTVRTLGNDEVTARTPGSSFLWANGQRTYSNETRGTVLKDGDIISLNHAIRTPGLTRTNCIIGDMAYDYDVDAIDQTYYPRNIDIGIVPPGDGGVHVRTITLPVSFVPCLMSVEYGTIRVNEAHYYGNFLVGSRDVITVEIDARQNSALPVLTIGRRQFVIPVSFNPGPIAPRVLLDIELDPNTAVVKQIDFGELPSLFDYIIPGYYDITIKKNSLDITGNYYQQFGKNDQLIVEYSSSRKLYDTTDVYILGSTNYRFTARNKVGRPVDYLNYGNIVQPYTRLFDYYSLSSSVSVGAPYSLAQQFATPEVQYITANLTISGLVNNSDANLSVAGGDSYFVINGTITSATNVTVNNGDQVGLARNVMSYHDVAVQVIQHLPTGDEDGWADVSVGIWEIVNRIVDEPETTEAKNLHDLSESAAGTPSINSSIMVIDSLAQMNKLSARNILAYREQLNSPGLLDAQQSRLTMDQTNIADAQQSVLIIDRNNIADSRQADLQFNAEFAKTDLATTGALLRGNGRTIIAAREILGINRLLQIDKMPLKINNNVLASSTATDLLLDKNPVLSDLSSVVQKVGATNRVLNAATIDLTVASDQQISAQQIVFDRSTVSESASGKVTFAAGSAIELPGNATAWAQQANGATGIYKLARFVLNIRAVVANQEQLVQSESVVLFDRKFARTETTSQVPEALMNPVISVATSNTANTIAVERARDRKMLIPSRREQLNTGKSNIMSPMARTNQYRVSDTVSDMPATTLQNSAEPIFNFVTAALTSATSWVDADTRWQGFVYSYLNANDSTPVHNVIGKIVEFYAVPAATGLGNAVMDRITPLTAKSYQSDWDLLTVQNGQLGVINIDATPGQVLQLPFASGLKIQPYGQGTINFVSSVTGPGTVTYNYASVDLQGFGTTSHYAFAPTAPELEPHVYTMDRVEPDLDSVGTAVFAKQFMYKFELSEPSRQLVLAEYNQRNFQPVATDFRTHELGSARTPALKFVDQRWVEYRLAVTEPAAAETTNLTTGFTPSEKFITNLSPALIEYESRVSNLWPVTAVYAKARTSDPTLATMDYATDTLFTSSVSMKYARNDVLPITMVVPTWVAAEYGFEAFVIYRLQHQQQNDYADSRMTLAREIPNHYFTAITVPELNNGILWDHDISVEYGAFATEADAIYAARNYTEFRPYLIMDTDLWSYRVILDTGLICSLPKGRYPIAWLLRGG